MEGLTAQDILETLYGQGCVTRVAEIVVITKGSCYSAHTEARSDTPVFWPFEQGEIVLLDASGREPFGAGRKPSKWDVEAATCPTLALARGLSRIAKAADPLFMEDYKKSWTAEEREGFGG